MMGQPLPLLAEKCGLCGDTYITWREVVDTFGRRAECNECSFAILFTAFSAAPIVEYQI